MCGYIHIVYTHIYSRNRPLSRCKCQRKVYGGGGGYAIFATIARILQRRTHLARETSTCAARDVVYTYTYLLLVLAASALVFAITAGRATADALMGYILRLLQRFLSRLEQRESILARTGSYYNRSILVALQLLPLISLSFLLSLCIASSSSSSSARSPR